MTGSGFAYVGRAILWDLLTLISLGFAYAWRSAALERYKMGNTRYGDMQGRSSVAAGRSSSVARGSGPSFSFSRGRRHLRGQAGLGVRDRSRRALALTAPFLFPIFQAMELRCGSRAFVSARSR